MELNTLERVNLLVTDAEHDNAKSIEFDPHQQCFWVQVVGYSACLIEDYVKKADLNCKLRDMFEVVIQYHSDGGGFAGFQSPEFPTRHRNQVPFETKEEIGLAVVQAVEKKYRTKIEKLIEGLEK